MVPFDVRRERNVPVPVEKWKQTVRRHVQQTQALRARRAESSFQSFHFSAGENDPVAGPHALAGPVFFKAPMPW